MVLFGILNKKDAEVVISLENFHNNYLYSYIRRAGKVVCWYIKLMTLKFRKLD